MCMKKMLLILLFVLVSVMSYGQVSIGSYTRFPNSKLFGLYYKPQLAFGKVDDIYLLALCYTSPTNYVSFDKESIMLLKFGDDSTAKLHIFDENVVKDYETSWNSGTKQYNDFYRTYACFIIDDSIVQRIVNDKEVIKKIRVSFTNGDIEDWDIDTKYQKKLTEGLNESYNIVEKEDSVRKEKINDVESGF